MTKSLRKAFLCMAGAVCMLSMLFAVVILAACGEKPAAQEHTLTFVTGGGAAIEPITAKAGESITPPADPTQDGFDFEGWYLTSDGNGERQTVPTVMPDEDITYYAKWAALSVLTLDLDGGTFVSNGVTYENEAELTLKAGADLYAALTQITPVRGGGYQFGAWFIGAQELADGTKMPAGGLTLTAKWKVPVAISIYKLDFVTYDEYVEDEEAATTIFVYEGTTLSGEEYVPEHYHLGSQTETVTVNGLETELNLYVEPIYVAYGDVFESTDIIYWLESDPEHLYLDRIELGRKVSTSFNADSGLFTFETDGGFVLEGKISGENFYYFRDTVEKTFTAFDGSDATLEIKSFNEVVYTDAKGKSTTGSYDVDAETGRYQFISDTLRFEFLLYADGLDLQFRTNDGLDGFYTYDDGDLDGGWVLIGFDGFGTVTQIEDDGYVAYYDYIYLGNDIVSIIGLSTVKLDDKKMSDVGGYAVKGEFHLPDAYAGEYIYTNGGRRDVLTLDGFGTATYTRYANDVMQETASGVYTVQSDESWYVRSYNDYYGAYVKSLYSGVNTWLSVVYTVVRLEDGVELAIQTVGREVQYTLSSVTDEFGLIVESHFDEYKSSGYDVTPGRHEITTSFVLYGTNYAVDDNHKAFLYFLTKNYNNSSYQAVQLWYGTKDAAGDFVYQYFVYAAWYKSGNEIFVPGGYDGLYFTDNGDGTYAYDEEDYDGEVTLYVFIDDANGKLTIDGAGVALYTPANGEAYKVSYSTEATGLITIYEFSGLPAGVHTTFALYTDAYRYDSEYETFIYDITDSVYEIAYTDGTEGGDMILVVTEGYTFLGIAAADYYGNAIIDFIFAGNVEAVAGSTDEFTFVWDDDVWYEQIEYYEDIDDIVAAFGEFRYKVIEDTFLYYDGVVLDLTSGSDAFVSDGYGSATFTQGNVAKEGAYYVEYTLIVFIDEDGEETALKLDDPESPTTFKILQNVSGEFGTYYGTRLYDGVPTGFLGDVLFFDGDGNVLYGDVTWSEDYIDYDYVELYGAYELIGFMNQYVDEDKGVVSALEYRLTFAENDVRTVLVMLYEMDGYYYGFFTVKSEIYLGEYEAVTDDGAALGTLMGDDGYSTYTAEFFGEDADGEFYYVGYMARGFIQAEYYNQQAQFVEDAAGDVVVFVAIDEDGYADLQFVFDIAADGKVVYRSLFYGTLAERTVKDGYSGNYLRLDGHGVAKLYNGDNVLIATGEYMLVPELGKDVYLFAAGAQRFTFKPEYSATEAATTYTYTKYTEADDGIYINDDWSLLWLDGFGKAVYIDVYGAVTNGQYYEVIEGEKVYCIKVNYSDRRIYLELNADGGFALCDGEFLIRNGVLYAYFGSDTEIRIPDSVNEIAAQAFILTGANNVEKIDFNNVTKIDANAFYQSTSLVELSSEKITEIGAQAFEGVWTLERVNLPNLVTLGNRAFYGCMVLSEVVLGKIETVGANAFSRSIAFGDTPPLVLDLTASINPAAIQIDLTAFQAARGWMGLVDELMLVEGSKILIGGDVDTLNAVLKSTSFKGILHLTVQRPNTTEEVDWTVDLTPYVELTSADDPVAGTTYYSLANDVIFTFAEGTLVKYVFDGSYGYDETSLGSYYVKDGTVYLYSPEGGQYAVTSSFTVGGNSVTIGGIEAHEAGKTVTVTFTTAEGKSLVLSYNATVQFYYGASLSVFVEEVTYDGNAATGIDFTKSSGLLTFNANTHAFSATLSEGVWTVVDNGVEYVLYDKTNDAIWFKAILTVSDEGDVVLKSLQYNSYGADYPDYFYNVYDYTKIEGENAWTFSQNNALYTLRYVSAQGETPASIAVTNSGYSIKDSGYNYTITLKIDESNDTIIEIVSFADYYGNPYEIIGEIAYSADKKSATLATEDGTFILTLGTNYYDEYTVTVTKTNYEYSKELYDAGYSYKVTVTIKVDADGNKKIVGFTSLYDWDTLNDYLTVDTWNVSDNGVLTLHLEDGRTATVTLVVGGYSDTVKIEWAD